MRKPGVIILELADRIGDQYVLERLKLDHEVIVIEREPGPQQLTADDLAPPAPTENWFLPAPEEPKVTYREYLSKLPGNRKRNKRRNRRR